MSSFIVVGRFRTTLTKRFVQKLVKLRHNLLVEVVAPQEGFESPSVRRLAFMEAMEGTFDIEYSIPVFNLRERRDFSSH